MNESKAPHYFLFCGIKHSGKSSHALYLAHKWQLPFYDLDDLLIAAYRRSTGNNDSVRELYRKEGKKNFQQWETAAVEQLLNHRGPLIAAGGGGIIDNRAALELFQRASPHRIYSIYLHLEEDVLFRRIAEGGIPPFLEGPGGEEGARERFHRLYTDRDRSYRRFSDRIINLEDRNQQENSDLIARDLEDLHP